MGLFGLPAKRMAWLCRTFSTMAEAGLPTTRVLDVLAQQVPGARLASGLRRARQAVDAGATLAEALERQHLFPRLFLQLVEVGEASGTLERATAELARYYELQQRLWHTFLSRIALPATQYVVAVAVIAFATYVINWIGGSPGGAAPILMLGYGTPVALVCAYVFLVRPLGGTRIAHEVLLRLPVVSGVVRSLALARFSLVMYLTFEAGVPVKQALTQAFEATNNGAFEARGMSAVEAIDRRKTLTEALHETGLFPREYMDVVEIAEESGKLSDRFEWLADHHAERAEFALGLLMGALAKAIWVVVAIFIIIFIVRFFSMYAGAIEGAVG